MVIKAVRFQNFISVPVLSRFRFFLESNNLGSVRFRLFSKKEEQYKCMNSFMYVSSIFTK
jgi:hypothetical protein